MATRRRSPEEVAKSMAAAKRIKAKEVLNEQLNKIRWARTVLLILGVLQIVIPAVLVLRLNFPVILLGIDGGIGLVFIGMYLYSKERPHAAFMAGFVFYLVVQALVVVFDTASLANGWLFKVIVISALLGGMRAIQRIPKSLMENKDSGILDDVAVSKDLL